MAAVLLCLTPASAAAACRAVTVTATAPTVGQAAQHSQRMATERARAESRALGGPSGLAGPSVGLGQMVTTCSPGERSICTSRIVVCR